MGVAALAHVMVPNRAVLTAGHANESNVCLGAFMSERTFDQRTPADGRDRTVNLSRTNVWQSENRRRIPFPSAAVTRYVEQLFPRIVH